MTRPEDEARRLGCAAKDAAKGPVDDPSTIHSRRSPR
jgi:hypothetical protein